MLKERRKIKYRMKHMFCILLLQTQFFYLAVCKQVEKNYYLKREGESNERERNTAEYLFISSSEMRAHN